MPATPARAGWDAGLGQNDRLSPVRPAAISQTELRRVVLVESDQYYREVLTFELLCQGFVVHAFADGAALLGSLASAVDADLAVLDWDLAKMPGIELLAELRRHGVNLPVAFLTGKVIAGDEHDRCLLAPQETLNANECVAFDHGAVDFIAKSRGRQVLVRRLRNVVELAKPKAKTDLQVQDRLVCAKLVLKPEISRERGVVAEVEGLFRDGVRASAHAFSGLVYRQVVEMLQGVRDEPDTRALIVRENMRYAKRPVDLVPQGAERRWLDGAG